MDINNIIIGGIGLLSTIVSGWTSWFFARKKYNSEVDKSLINNMEESLEFYKKLSDDNSTRLKELVMRNRDLELEIQELRKQVLNLTMNICMDLTCASRIRERQILVKKKNAKSSSRFDETQDPNRG